MTPYAVVASEIRDTSEKLLGICHLFRNYNNDSGTWELERDAMSGLGTLLEWLYRDLQRVTEIVERLHLLAPNLELDRCKYDNDPLARVEKAIDAACSSKTRSN